MRSINRFKVEYDEKWTDLIQKIPSIDLGKLPKGALIQIIPPFSGAISRFVIKNLEGDVWISVYLDFYDTLGWVGQPYYEVYPNLDDDTSRFLLTETNEMCEEICKIYKKQLEVRG